MARGRRLSAFLVVPVVLLCLVSTATQAAAQGFKPAGNYRDSFSRASFSFQPADSSQTSVDFSIFRQTVVALAPADPSNSSDSANLFLSVSTDFFFGQPSFNCFVNLANPADFVVTTGAKSASLHTTIPQASCNGASSDVTLDVTWTGSGPIQSTNTSSRFSCNGYTGETQSSDTNNAGSATFDVTGLAAPITSTAPQVFDLSTGLEHVQGQVPPDSCRGSIGRGAGRPTPAAGNYHTTLQEAGTFFFSSDFTTVLFLLVDLNTNTSNPLVGSSTSSTQTTVSLTFNSPSGSVGGCFIVDSSAFTVSGASTAHLKTDLSLAQTCGGPNPFASAFGIDAVWTATSPPATTTTDSQYACLGYHFQTNFTQTVSSAGDVTLSMPGFSSTLTGSSDLGFNDTRTHADGVASFDCGFRG